MCILIRVPMQVKGLDLNPAVSTFISTVVSGGSFTVCLFLFMNATSSGMVAYVPIVLFTALINSVIVHLLYIPLRKVLKK